MEDEKKKECTFKPEINKKSIEIAEKLPPVEERLLTSKEPTAYNAPSFVPKIDPISDEIAKRSVTEKEGAPLERWEHLFEVGEQKRAELEQKRQKVKEEQTQKEQYTFKPQLIAQESILSEGRALPLPVSYADKSVPDRTTAWLRGVDEKVKALKDEVSNKSLEGCTFKPHLISLNKEQIDQSTNSANEDNPSSRKTVEKYIEKQKILREAKEETQWKATQFAGSGNLWKKQITVPKAPNFNGQEGGHSVTY